MPAILPNRLADFLVSWAAGHAVADSQSGQRLYPAALLEGISLRHDEKAAFTLESEIIIEAARRGYTCVGVPILVGVFHGNPAVMVAIGMLTGYCGTLLTPMAANFNIVPAVLLDLPDQYGVIRAQWPTALILLAVNFMLMWMLVFR